MGKSVNSRGRRPPPPGVSAADDIAAMIRVDHAGEYGAVRIYAGQLAVLGGRRSKASDAIRRMAEQEAEHLKRFDALINERRVRPTALQPLWQIAGYTLGAATALMGEKAAMACTEAVEDVIDEHYAEQIERLDATDPALKKTLEAFRADEIAHRDLAIEHGSARAPGYRLLTGAVKAGCRMAIALSTRI